MSEQKMNFYRSLYDLAGIMPTERSRQRLITAMVDYFFEGIEPEGLNARETKAFEAVRGRIYASRKNAENRRGKTASTSGNDEKEPEVVANETDNEPCNETCDESGKGYVRFVPRSDEDRYISPSLSLEKNKSRKSTFGTGRGRASPPRPTNIVDYASEAARLREEFRQRWGEEA